MKFVRALPGFVLVLVAHAADVPSQPVCRFAGRVLNSLTGEPLKKAQLTLRSTTSPNLTYAFATDEQGAFLHPAVAGGAYDLIVQRPGFVQMAKALTIAVGDSETMVRLTPQGVITGRVVDRDGDPIVRATVEAIEAHYENGMRRYVVSGTTASNDLGEYRIYGLKPGTYYLGGVSHGPAGDAAAYYPGSLQVSQAAPIDVPAGTEIRGIDLTLSETRGATIRGVVQAAGLPLRGVTVATIPCDWGPLDRVSSSVRSADGAFELAGVEPGCHILAADSFSMGKRYSARLSLNVADSNIESVRVNLLPPIRVTGRVHSESGSAPKAGKMIVTLVARSSSVTASGSPGEDGGLSIDNIVPETYEISATLPEGYFLKSARLGNVDALQSGVDVSQGESGKLDLEISATGGRVEGSVTEGDQPSPGARVVLMPGDERNRRLRFQIATADQKGVFRISGIAPGDYRLYGFQTVDESSVQDPSYLKRFESQSKQVSIHEHGRETLQLEPIRDAGGR
jgi:hypothetical protein